MPEPRNAEELFAPPCEECAAAARSMVLGAIVAGAVVGIALGWVVFRAK